MSCAFLRLSLVGLDLRAKARIFYRTPPDSSLTPPPLSLQTVGAGMLRAYR